jgi:DNA-binding IclR family transcriptional regulator
MDPGAAILQDADGRISGMRDGRVTKALKTSYSAPALEKAVEIIELMGDHPGGMLVTEMANLLGRSVGELFRIVIVMERLGLLRKSARTDRYTVAYRLLDLAYRATPAQNLVAAALPAMQALAFKAGQSCHLVVPSAGEGLVIAREQQPGMRGFSLRVGARIDIVQSCSGQVLLAFSADAAAERLVAAAEAAGGALVDRAWLAERRAETRARGYQLRQSPITHGVTDISYPVLGFDGTIVAALTIPFLEMIDGSQKVDQAAARVLLGRAAGEIADELGYQAPPPADTRRA